MRPRARRRDGAHALTQRASARGHDQGQDKASPQRRRDTEKNGNEREDLGGELFTHRSILR